MSAKLKLVTQVVASCSRTEGRGHSTHDSTAPALAYVGQLGKPCRMSAAPFWFGPSDRALFGWLHAPESGSARAGVVLCPPLGIEAICTYFTYRTVADRIAEGGLAALRFDYDGTGDSVGGQADPDRVAAWRRSVQHAVTALKAAGVEKIALLGMRVGALFAAAEAERIGGVDAMVLWDPSLSGQAVLRELKVLRALGLGGDIADDGSVESPGMVFDPTAVADLSSMTLTKGPRLAARILVLEDPQRTHSTGLAARLSESEVEWIEATGQNALLDPPRQETPWSSVEDVSTWLIAQFAASPLRLVQIPKSDSAVVTAAADGATITERVVWLGPHELFGMVTESNAETNAPTIIFVNEGNTPHIGQSRMWVELAREWAKAGLRVLRFDLSGNGDSAARPGQDWHVTRAVEAFDDVTDACSAISPSNPSDVVLIGLCSGAYQAVEAGLSLKPRGICLVNPVLSFMYPERVLDPKRRARQATRPWFVTIAGAPTLWAARRQQHPDPGRWSRSLEIATWPAAVARRHPWIPEFVWRGVRRAILTRPSADVLEAVVNGGVRTTLIVCEQDLLPIALGARHVLSRLATSPLFEVQVPAGLDHAGLIMEQRTKLMQAMTSYIVGTFAPGE